MQVVNIFYFQRNEGDSIFNIDINKPIFVYRNKSNY